MEDKDTTGYRVNDYLYHLPQELIAQAPNPQRTSSRLLVLDRSGGCLADRRFADVAGYLREGDVLVVNDTRVVPARLRGTKEETGGRVELLVTDPYKDPEEGQIRGYGCLVKASKRPRAGARILLDGGVEAEFLTTPKDGKALLRFLTDEPLLSVLDRCGEVPLPPYIRRDGEPDPSVNDAESYQTVYAETPGAVAAPTAGLHFSPELLATLKSGGIETVSVTLHVGYGTFAPIRSDDIREHRIHSEYVEVSVEAAEAVAKAKREGRRIVAVGTTVVRTLEWAALQCGGIAAWSGECTHYIYPGYTFKVIDAMITNFHLPQSTLLLLVSAFAGRETILKAYEHAVSMGYRFFSYGDAMLIL